MGIRFNGIETRIKEIRKSLGMTQSEFGESLGVNRTNIKNYELAIVNPPSIFLEHLCLKYGIDRIWLETGDGEMYCDSPDEELENELTSFLGAVINNQKPEECIDLLYVLARVKDDEWKILGSLVDQYAELRKMRKEKDDH